MIALKILPNIQTLQKPASVAFMTIEILNLPSVDKLDYEKVFDLKCATSASWLSSDKCINNKCEIYFALEEKAEETSNLKVSTCPCHLRLNDSLFDAQFIFSCRLCREQLQLCTSS